MNKPQPQPKLWTIPAGTRAAQCRGRTCEAPIFWITTPKGAKLCVDADCAGGQEPSAPGVTSTQAFDGMGVAHITQCPDAGQFSHRNG